MTRRVLWAAATAVALLLASQAHAQSTAGSEGNDAAEIAPDAVSAGSFTATADFPPPVDVDRAFGDEEVSVEGFGTVTFTAEGDEEELAPTRAVISASAVPGYVPEPSGGASREIATEATEEARIRDTTVYPFRAVGIVYARYGKDWYACTGTLIGPKTVLTFAHCLYGATGVAKKPDELMFRPGTNAPNYGALGDFAYASIKLPTGFVESVGGEFDSWSRKVYSLGLVILKKPIGNKLGWFGFQVDAGGFDANTVGYPGSKESETMWRANCLITEEMMWRSFAYHTPCQVYPRGAPLYVQDETTKERFIRALNNWGWEDEEFALSSLALRLSPIHYQWIVDNRQ
jgi:V8-like Glu-specific endopeptidase